MAYRSPLAFSSVAEEGYVDGTNYDAWAYFIWDWKKSLTVSTRSLYYLQRSNQEGMRVFRPRKQKNLAGSSYYNQTGDTKTGRSATHEFAFSRAYFYS